MSETYHCGIMTRAASLHEDPEPAEWCENEVSEEGEICTRHEDEFDAIARAEDDEYDRWKERDL